MPSRLPALIFDFGNVIAFFDYTLICNTLGRHVGLSGEQFLERAKAAGFTPLLQRYESGKITSEDFARAVCELLDFELSHPEFHAAWADMFWLNEPVAKLVAELKNQGYTLVLGSNTNEMHANHYQRQFREELAPFERLMFSHEVGHIKPNAEFYLACAQATGAEPADCIFIDDMPENVEGAKAAGLQSLLFVDEPTLRSDLRRLGIEIGA